MPERNKARGQMADEGHKKSPLQPETASNHQEGSDNENMHSKASSERHEVDQDEVAEKSASNHLA